MIIHTHTSIHTQTHTHTSIFLNQDEMWRLSFCLISFSIMPSSCIHFPAGVTMSIMFWDGQNSTVLMFYNFFPSSSTRWTPRLIPFLEYREHCSSKHNKWFSLGYTVKSFRYTSQLARVYSSSVFCFWKASMLISSLAVLLHPKQSCTKTFPPPYNHQCLLK